MIWGQSNFLQALGWAVLNSLWQMAFLWVIYQLFTAFSGKQVLPKKVRWLPVWLLLVLLVYLYIFFNTNRRYTW